MAGVTTGTQAHVYADEVSLVRSICLDSFYEFVRIFWPVVVAETPVWNWHIRFICDAFEHDMRRVWAGLPRDRDTIVNVPPGSTKSTILSIMAPAWCHAVQPHTRVLCASHTQKLVFELGRKCRMVEDSPLYREAFPEMQPTRDQWEKSFFMNTAGGGRFAATVGGMSPTGFHAHVILVDDPIDPQQAKRASATELKTANDFMSEVVSTRKVDKEVSVTWLIMQRLHQNDPTGFLLAQDPTGYRHICLPAKRTARVRPARLRRMYVDGLLDPVRIPPVVLEENKRKLGEYGYAGQFLQHPVPRGGGMFKVARIRVDAPPPRNSSGWVGLCRFWDKAGTSGGGAFTVGLLMGRFRPRGADPKGGDDVWWILDVVRGQWDSGEREDVIESTGRQDGKKVEIGIEQEPGSGGKESAERSIKRLSSALPGYRVRAIPAVGDKIDRAESWSQIVNAYGFRMVRADWNAPFIDEMRFFPYSTYKDQADAGSGAHAVLSKPRRVVGAF